MTEATEAGTTIVGKVAATAQYGGSAITLGSATKQYLGYTLDEWSLIGILFGIFLGIAGYVTSAAMTWHFRSQHLKIAREKAALDFYADEP